MPTQFANVEDYLSKQYELIETEAKVEQINQEAYAEKDVAFSFIEILEITCKLEMWVPKTNQQLVREGMILQVVISTENRHDD